MRAHILAVLLLAVSAFGQSSGYYNPQDLPGFPPALKSKQRVRVEGAISHIAGGNFVVTNKVPYLVQTDGAGRAAAAGTNWLMRSTTVMGHPMVAKMKPGDLFKSPDCYLIVDTSNFRTVQYWSRVAGNVKSVWR